MEIFKFANPQYFWTLWLVPFFLLLFLSMVIWRRKVIKRFGNPTLVRQMIPDLSDIRPVVKFMLLMFSLVFLIIGIANPQIGAKLEKIERKGIDLVIAVDVSESMLAQDIKPNRLQRARQALSRLVDELRNDRIGIVVFAGRAYVQLPITTDYAAVKMFVSTISTESVPFQGTAIAEAINLAVEMFDDSPTEKTIIIISDGEDHEGDIDAAISRALEKNIRIYTIGMGLPEGAPIPVYDQYGNQIGFKRDRNNNTVITRLNEEMLRMIAVKGNGNYIRANNVQVGLEVIFEEISKLEKTEFESMLFADYEHRFQYFLAISLILMIMEFLIFERRGKLFRNFNIFRYSLR